VKGLTIAREWRDEAACLSLGPAEADRVFFSRRASALAERAVLCASCPVRAECAMTEARIRAGR
jgi:hypothetical protein